MRIRSLRSALLVLLLAIFVLPGRSQDAGPLAPLPGKEVRRIPAGSAPDAPPIAVQEIIRQFTVREDEYSRAHLIYGFHRSIRLQEFPADGTPGGEMDLEEDISVAPNGKRYGHVTQRTSQQLKSSTIDIQDLKDMARMPLFPLTSDEAPRYTLTYVGSQPLDELNTYVFRVKPKQIERARRQFEGLVYVDDHDLSIVKVYGRWFADVDQPASEVSFVTFDVQRENVDGKYWFPDYMRSEDFLPGKAGETRLRLTIKMTGFKVGAPSAVPAPPANAPDSPLPPAPPEGAPAVPAPNPPAL